MPGWHAYPVAARLRRTFDCPVLLENDVNLRALGEARALPADQVRCCSSRSAPGSAVGWSRRAGELHHGVDGAAGDIGHIRVRGGSDVRCVCGNVGCIEALASAGAIARRLGGSRARGGERRRGPCPRARGDQTVLRLVREAAELIGEVVATLVHFYNPARVTIGGSVAAASDDLLAGIRSVVYQRALPLATRNLVLANSVLGEFAGVAGAAVLGIERVLSAGGMGRSSGGRPFEAPLRLTSPATASRLGPRRSADGGPAQVREETRWHVNRNSGSPERRSRGVSARSPAGATSSPPSGC